MKTNGFNFDEWTSLGRILIRRGMCTRRQLQRGREKQEAEGGLIGEILVGMGVCTEEEILDALSDQRTQRIKAPSNKTLSEAEDLMRNALGKIRKETDRMSSERLSMLVIK